MLSFIKQHIKKNLIDKGKPFERKGRKAKGSKALNGAMTAWPTEAGFNVIHLGWGKNNVSFAG